MSSTKNLRIESLRGFAIILVVFGHIVTWSLSRSGVDENHFLSFLYKSFSYIRMPLFSIISGYICSIRPVRIDNCFVFYKNKIRRLVIPCIFASAITWLFKFFPFSAPLKSLFFDFLTIFYRPLDHYWFLFAILWIFLAVSLLDSFRLMETPKKWLLVFSCGILVYLFDPYSAYEVFYNKHSLFGFHGACFLLPFFLFGYGLQRHGILFKNTIVRLSFISIALISFLLHLWNTYSLAYLRSSGGAVLSAEHLKILALVVGISCCGVLIFYSVFVPWLARIGKYAYGIYIYHILFIILMRIFLAKGLNVSSSWIHLFIELPCAVLFPIMLERFVRNRKYVSLVMFGQN